MGLGEILAFGGLQCGMQWPVREQRLLAAQYCRTMLRSQAAH